MAWVARIHPPKVDVRCGELVGVFDEGVYEGTWVGNSGVAAILGSTTTFGSGVLLKGDDVLVVPPSHLIENVYLARRPGTLLASNSLVGLLSAARMRLDPAADYPFLFGQTGDGIFRFSVPTLDGPIEMILFESLAISLDGSTRDVPKPREKPFESFADYRARIKGALESALGNCPAFAPVATISSGYDSATVATLASELGCRHALTIADGKPVRGSDSLSDSGESVAARLGMDIRAYRRLTYMEREDLVEADFLASGMSGEDVVLAAAENEMRNRTLLTGYYGDGVWWLNRPQRPLMWRLDQTGQSHTEFRLRVGYVHVPLPWFGATEIASISAINHDPMMRPWVLGMDNDRPIPRRILEEAGIPRGTFADAKRAPSASIHSLGPEALAPASRASVAAFAAAEGTTIKFQRRTFARWRRGALKVAKRLHWRGLGRWAERPRRQYQRQQPEFGNLLLRWAVEQVRPRFGAIEEWPE